LTPEVSPGISIGDDFPSTVIVADDLRFAGAEDVDVAVAIYPVIVLPPSLDGATNVTLTEVGPVGVATIEVTGPGTENDAQGTPGQFSNAAFFQRTLISSRLNEAFRFISNGCFSLVVVSPFCISPFALVCAKPSKGSIKRSKNLKFILFLLTVNKTQICPQISQAPNFVWTNPFKF
jgi:hypothetical protein